MIKRYYWHFFFLLFIVLGLANIFEKLKWSSSSDGILWQATEKGLVCLEAPHNHPVRPGDLLLTVNLFVINDHVDLARAIENRNYCRYEVERDSLLQNLGVDITRRFTPGLYYFLAFIGILFILLALRLLYVQTSEKEDISAPPIFFLLTLTFSGFLIFSPTGDYHSADFLYLILDNVSFAFFPALLIHYALYFPIKSKILHSRYIRPLLFMVYMVPTTILTLQAYFTVKASTDPINESLVAVIEFFRLVSNKYAVVFLFLAMVLFLAANLKLILAKGRKRYILPLSGILLALVALAFYIWQASRLDSLPAWLTILTTAALLFFPLSLTFFLAHKKFIAIENVIKKTLSVSSIFVFIFGIYLFLGLNIEQNKLLGIFWSIAAILMAGLLFKPIETNLNKYFERLFARGTFHFKNKLKELEVSIRSQRDLGSLASDFLGIINRGFQLQDSALIIDSRNGFFQLLPDKKTISISPSFLQDLCAAEHMVFLSAQEFKTKYPEDAPFFSHKGFFQFLSLRNNQRLIGFVAIGRKSDKNYLSFEDWEILGSVSSSLTLAVENALLYTELENQLDTLNFLKEFNENIIENINLGIVVLDPEGNIASWNRFMEEKYPLPREKALKEKFAGLFPASLAKRVSGRQYSRGLLHNVRLPLLNEEAAFDIYISDLTSPVGEKLGKILVFEDISEKILIQNQLLTSEKLASLGMISASIAHEVNTPLTGISSYCQFILDNPGDAAENMELVGRIQEQVQRANKIVRSLLDFSRQSGENPLEVDLERVIRESLSLLDHQLKKKGTVVEQEINLPFPVAGYPTRLQLVFMNLFINAMDAMDQGGKIIVKGWEEKNRLLISIEDFGRGMSENQLDKVFDPFFTTKEIGHGTGLGLSIAYNIVKEHFGQISVTSRIGQGTTFLLSFPKQSPLRLSTEENENNTPG